MAEIIPFEPDLGNAGVGSGDTKKLLSEPYPYSKGVWLCCFIPFCFLRLTLLATSSASSTYGIIRLRRLLLAASLSFGIEAV